MKRSKTDSLYYYKDLLNNRLERREFAINYKEYQSKFMDRIVEDCDRVEWISAMNVYKIVFTKEESRLIYRPDSFHYIITMEVIDNMIGITILSIKMTEFDIIDMLVKLTANFYLIFEFNGEADESFFMNRLNKNIVGSLMDTIMIDIQENEKFPSEVPFTESIYFCEKYNELRDLNFIISFYNKATQSIERSLLIPICGTEVYDIIEAIMYLLSDITLPTDQEEYLDIVIHTMDY